MTTPYQFYYWPMLQGRGEFVRLALEEAGASYVDVARLPEQEGGGVAAILEFLRGERGGQPPYAPPILVDGELVLAQSGAICAYLAQRHDLAPRDTGGRWEALQLQLTIADVAAEAHDTHHPISSALYFEEQEEEAKRSAHHFIDERMPGFLDYFERVVEASGGPWLMGDRLTYPDLSLFQLLEGLEYAFPRGFARVSEAHNRILRIRDAVRARPRIGEYLASDRRIPFNEVGVFRHYPGLDDDYSRS
jgi:glutathione S-transferase